MHFLATYTKLGDHAYIMQIGESIADRNRGGGDSDEESVIDELENLHMTDVVYRYESSIYSTSTDGSQSNRLTPVPDDANSELHPKLKRTTRNIHICRKINHSLVCFFV